MAGRSFAAEPLPSCFFEPGCAENFAGVMGRGLIENSMLYRDQQLVVTSPKTAGQGKVSGLHDDPFAHHIPELFLGEPVLFVIVAQNQGGLLDFHIPKTNSRDYRRHWTDRLMVDLPCLSCAEPILT